MGAGGVYFALRFFVLMKRIRNLSFQLSRLYFLWNLQVIYLCTVWLSSMRVSDGLTEVYIAGMHVTSRRPRLWSITKGFLSSGYKTLFSCKFIEKKYFIALTPNMAPCHVTANQE